MTHMRHGNKVCHCDRCDSPMESICDRCSIVIKNVQKENCCPQCGGTFCDHCMEQLHLDCEG